MKLGVMQPYFFPYIGYWQLMNAVDTYVIFDDVAYIKRGWINRNRIKMNGTVQRIGISIKHASQNKKINELYLAQSEKETAGFFRSLELSYKKAPYYDRGMAIAEKALCGGKENLAEFLAESMFIVADYLGIHTKFLFSSSLEKDESLKAQDKILEICHILEADTYINAAGGRALYHPDVFRKQGIELRFLETDGDIVYPQGKGDFIPNLSILDVIMYNEKEDIRRLLEKYTFC
ncbi:WbqC-like protein [Marvinbryantia formatexigens DSM 14469]|uniref:WbqC-like protein n=1 Tax=Marvinbryantia formatexigens DSM 14469 TaxID=478749 RepID=C6LCQ9_9FIRM|nr:WbqC family protein [Marvinbryantia formatexigens]EET61723.1 WbqC-like protein [Marvinbryantia formatexigens DSM 14469]UWO24464.1 WbqC family protein [Marvinbryantia formatexigens DSM 14469]SDF08983.1 WbqC-like protein family protein [Marvinbryantia formatexigens]